MPQDTTQQTDNQAPNTEKLLMEFLKEMEMRIEDLSQRVDVLEQEEQGEAGGNG